MSCRNLRGQCIPLAKATFEPIELVLQVLLLPGAATKGTANLSVRVVDRVVGVDPGVLVADKLDSVALRTSGLWLHIVPDLFVVHRRILGFHTRRVTDGGVVVKR